MIRYSSIINKSQCLASTHHLSSLLHQGIIQQFISAHHSVRSHLMHTIHNAFLSCCNPISFKILCYAFISRSNSTKTVIISIISLIISSASQAIGISQHSRAHLDTNQDSTRNSTSTDQSIRNTLVAIVYLVMSSFPGTNISKHISFQNILQLIRRQ